MTISSDYEILERIHESSNSLVYRAQRRGDDRTFILKVLNKAYPAPEEITKYRREYLLTRNFQDLPSVIEVFALEEHQNTMAIVLEDFGAVSLDKFLSDGPLQLRDFLKIAILIAGAFRGDPWRQGHPQRPQPVEHSIQSSHGAVEDN